MSIQDVPLLGMQRRASVFSCVYSWIIEQITAARRIYANSVTLPDEGGKGEKEKKKDLTRGEWAKPVGTANSSPVGLNELLS